MNGKNKWEEAWRAFDSDLQSSNDFAMFSDNNNSAKEIFDEIAEEFNVTSSEISTRSKETDSYEKAWRRLGAWIHRNQPTLSEASERYSEIINELGLDDDPWNELS